MRIGDVEQLTGLSRKTIRFYETKGMLNVGRSENTYREFDRETVERLKCIAALRRSGVSLSDIQLWLDGVITPREMLQKRLSELRSAADLAKDQFKLCHRLLDSLSGNRLVPLDDISDGSFQEESCPETVLHTPCIGLDIGTTTISAVILDIQTGICAEAYTLPNDSNLAAINSWEKLQDVRKITDRIHRLMDSLLRRHPDIQAIGITGQMHGIVYLDATGRPLSPLHTWQDARAGQGSPSACAQIAAKTDWTVAPGYGLATHYANLLTGTVPADAAKICTVMDYIAMDLCGLTTPVMHSSNAASLGFFRLTENCFDQAALMQLGIDPAILPSVTSQCQCLGQHHGIPVSVAIGDNQASFLGSVRDPSRTVLANLGTGSQISVMAEQAVYPSDDPAIETRPLLDQQCLRSGSALCGGRAYALLESFFRRYMIEAGLEDKPQYELLNRLALAGMEQGNYLQVQTTFCGTRADPALRGSISGIGLENLTPQHLAAGTLWGIVTELYEMFLQFPHDRIDTLVASGNAVRKNPAMQNMLREVFGMEVLIPVHQEEAAYGAALFVALAAGFIPSFDALGSCIRYQTAFSAANETDRAK